MEIYFINPVASNLLFETPTNITKKHLIKDLEDTEDFDDHESYFTQGHQRPHSPQSPPKKLLLPRLHPRFKHTFL